jgi:hypothetical protein
MRGEPVPLSKEQLETRLDWIEGLITKERDEKNLPYLNATYQKLMDKLVQIDLAEEDRRKAIPK